MLHLMKAIIVANRPRLGGYSQARTLVHSYARMPAGQEPAGKVQLDRDQLFVRDRFSTDRISYVYMYLPIPR